MQNIRIEKRVPFGFRGEWGKLYKLYTADVTDKNGLIKYSKAYYREIGQDVQFKFVENEIDKRKFPYAEVENLITCGEYRVVDSTDAYFDTDRRRFHSVVGVGDVVYLAGDWWTVDKEEERNIYTPLPQTFYRFGLKIIKEDLTTDLSDLTEGNDDVT